MKFFLPLVFVLLTITSVAQKYVLIDEKMTTPVTFTNSVTLQHDYHDLFAVEKSSLNEFLSQVEKIAKELTSKTGKIESFNLSVGNTKFIGLKVHLTTEDRLDLVMITDCGAVKTSMHLCDAKVSNANNAFFIRTWVKYIRSYVK